MNDVCACTQVSRIIYEFDLDGWITVYKKHRMYFCHRCKWPHMFVKKHNSQSKGNTDPSLFLSAGASLEDSIGQHVVTSKVPFQPLSTLLCVALKLPSGAA